MTYTQAVLSDAPLGYWPLDDPSDSAFLADLSGHGYTGTIVGSLLLAQPGATALLGPAAQTYAYRAYITVPGLDGHLPVGGEPYSIECWAGRAFSGSSGTFVFWGDFATPWSGSNSFNALLNDGTGNLRAAWAGNNLAWTNSLAVPVDFETAWHHVAVTCDGTTDALYVDGTQVADRPASYSAYLGHNLILGAFPANNWVVWGGLQHIAIYAHALSRESIARHYALAFPYQGVVLADGPAAYWPLAESSGPTYADISGHDYSVSASADPVPGVAGPFASWSELSRSGWTATDSTSSSGAYTPANALDDDLGTAWVSATDQVAGMWFAVDMGAAHDVNRIRMQASGDPGQFPAQFQLMVSADGDHWLTVASGSGDTSAVLTLEFPVHHARYLRVQLTAATAHWWAIGEFRADVNANLAVRFRMGGVVGGTESGLETHPPLSVDAWVKLDGDSDPRGYGHVNPLFVWGTDNVPFAPGAQDRLQVGLYTYGTGLGLSVSNSGGGLGTGTTFSGPFNGSWHHVALVVEADAVTYTIYVDGLAVGTAANFPVATLTSPSSGAFYIGGVPGDGLAAWGDMAYVALYPAALSGARVAVHAAGGVDSSAYQSAVLADSPLGYWKLGEASGSATVADSSTHTRTGTVHGPLVLGSTTPDGPGRAALFPDDDAAYISFSPTGLPTTTAYSLEAWIKPIASTHSQRTMIAYGTQGPTNHVNWWMTADDGVGETLDSVWGSNDFNHAVSPLENAWHHCVVTWNGTTRTIYLDGVSIGTQASSGMNVDLSGGGMLGRALNGLNQMDGHMAHVAIYGSALSSGRVAAHYAAFPIPSDATYRSAVLADSPSGFWPLQET